MAGPRPACARSTCAPWRTTRGWPRSARGCTRKISRSRSGSSTTPIDDGRDNPESYRLFTTILDPAQASATELAAAYAERWEIELAFDELKTHQRGPRTVLRSKSPELVLQEIWGHLCCHYAIRTLMADAATHSGHDPDRVSFVAALRITRQSVAHQGAFPP